MEGREGGSGMRKGCNAMEDREVNRNRIELLAFT